MPEYLQHDPETGQFRLVMAASKSVFLCPVVNCNNPNPKFVDGKAQTGHVCSKCKMRLWRANNPNHPNRNGHLRRKSRNQSRIR